METQTDSIDISQLKAYALGLDNDYSQQRDLPLVTATARKQKHQRPSKTLAETISPSDPPSHQQQPQHSTQSQLWAGNRSPFGPSGSRRRRPQQSASQPEMPSTIPDSSRARMLSNGSQSQGDTQPISQSFYEEYNTRSKQQRTTKDASDLSNTLDAQETAPHTIQQGETGHIDLLAAFEQPSLDDVEDFPADLDEDDVDPLSQDVRAEIFPESRRFQLPKTPASQGKKRKREIDSSPRGQPTPGLPINPFAGQMGGIDGLMGASQLFQTTQALTSPLTNMLPSDGLSERPSPDMHNLQRPSTAGSLSSPARMTRSNVLRAVTEPQTTYISMKESQEERDRLLEENKALQALLSDQLSDEDFGNNTQLRRRLRQKQYSMEARRQFAGVAARSEAAARGRGRGRGGRTRNTPIRTSPRKFGTQVSKPVLISDDAPAENIQGSITEDETEREEEADGGGEEEGEDSIDELAEDNKENIEVPMTISRAHHTTSQVNSSQPTPSHRPMKRHKVGSQTREVVQVDGSSQQTRSQGPMKAPNNGTQPDAIADSQSSQHNAKSKNAAFRPGKRAFSEPHSSLESRVLVPQSQSSESSRALRASNKSIQQRMAKASSQPPPSSSPQHPMFERESAPGGAVIERKTRNSEEGAVVKVLQKEGSDDAVPGSENSHDPYSKAAQSVKILSPNRLPQQSTIPETSSNTERIHKTQESLPGSSNAMPSPRTTPKSASKVASSYSMPDPSHISTLYETAPENLANSPSKSNPQRIVQNFPTEQSSPAKSRRLRTIGEIAADPSPPDALGDVDLDINLLSSEDIEFQKTIRGSSPIAPAEKRRRGGRGLALQVGEPVADTLPRLPRSPLPPPSSAISAITPVPSSSSSRVRASARAKMATNQPDPENTQPSESNVAPAQERAVKKKATTLSMQTTKRPAINLGVKPQVATSVDLGISAPTSSKETTAPEHDTAAVENLTIIAPNRVFAHFNGANPAYHPATCLEVIGGGEPRYSVRFDDGTVDIISAYGIKRLEFRVGDVIKVDLPGARTKSYVVEGMRDQQRPATPPDPETPSRRGRQHSTNDSAFPETDIHGYATVLASPKQRASVDGNRAKDTQIAQIAIPLTQIYFTQTLWTAYKNRQYAHVSNRLQTLTGLQTPSERPSTPSTPSSRTRRFKTSVLAQSRSMAAGLRTSDALFKNMAFAITNVDRSEDSKRVKDHIVSNGGTILDNGFDELFNIPALDRTSSPKKRNVDSTFCLTPDARNMGFTCLIADKHCRRAKFVQALALGIPCLATRWISDCVTKQRILPWAPYLLPSGESAFLGGAIRSRVLHSFPAEDSTLSGIVDSRPQLLDGASVLMIMEKGQQETMKHHPLITHALGASKIVRAVSEDAAVKAVADAQALGEPWDWVFSYDKEKAVEKRLFVGDSAGKKRKRSRESEVADPLAKKSKTKVVGNEFVIQSLILGMLVNE